MSSTNSNFSTQNETVTCVTLTETEAVIYSHPQFGGRPLYLEPQVQTPPVDYEDPDSGTGDSDHDDRSAASSSGTATISTTTTSSSAGELIHFCKRFLSPLTASVFS